jgi:hypothetical protein
LTSGPVAGILTEADFPEWNRLVAQSSEGSVYSLPEYLAALCEAAGGSFRILAVRQGDEIVGGVGLYERGEGRGRFVGPRLLLYYNGIVLRTYESRYPSQRTARRNTILEALASRLPRLGYGRIALRCRSPLSDIRVLLAKGWSALPQYSYVVPVANPDALWSRMEQNLRRLVERCREKGVTITEDDDFDGFYRLHAQVHERKGARLYLPATAFRRYFDRLRNQGLARLFHARLPGGEPVSSQLVLLGPHPVTHTASAAADAAHLKLGATAFLRWNVFRRLAELGYAANDLTDANLSSVTHFKAQLGGDLEMGFLLEAPESARFRMERASRSVGTWVRRTARRVARRFPGSRTGSTSGQ